MPVWSKNLARLPLLVLAVAEASALFASVYIAQAVSVNNSEEFVQPIRHGMIITPVIMLSLVAMGLYEFHQRIHFQQVLIRLIVGTVLGAVLLLAMFVVFPWISITPKEVAVFLIAALAFLFAIRWAFTRVLDRNVFRRRTIVLGAGRRAATIFKLRRRADRRGFEVVASVPTPGDQANPDSEKSQYASKRLPDIVRETGANEIVIAMDDQRGALPVRELLDCKLIGINIIDLLEFLERETGKIRLDLVKPGWLILAPGFRANRMKDIIKRTLDVMCASISIVLLSPVMICIALAIKLNEGISAPILYRQRRVGRGNSSIDVLKFRSMRVDAEADGKARWAEIDDERVTPVGAVLRKYRLDELPQLFNILMGEMSLVGPRPERPEFIAELADELPYYAERHAVKPGLTGWAQLKYAYGSSTDDSREKLQYDLWYVKHQSLVLDLMIMLQTAEVIIWGKGAR